MDERETKSKQLEVFKENFKNGLGDLLELLEISPDAPLPPDPYSLGFDERTFEDLDRQEKEAAQEILYQQLGLDPERLDDFKVREYISKAPDQARVPGKISVVVYRTNKEDVFLQELTFEDGEKRWVVGPDLDI